MISSMEICQIVLRTGVFRDLLWKLHLNLESGAQTCQFHYRWHPTQHRYGWYSYLIHLLGPCWESRENIVFYLFLVSCITKLTVSWKRLILLWLYLVVFWYFLSHICTESRGEKIYTSVLLMLDVSIPAISHGMISIKQLCASVYLTSINLFC